ncbi:MAG: hypothetical protein PHZ00_04210 [Candidatus Peribacteraceae bacterium]|nr:hypothetical protein [Candidatus Peribacteraceae bacterium]
MANNSDITLLTILQYMQAMEERLIARIAKVEFEVGGLKITIGGLETNVEGLNHEVMNLGERVEKGFAQVSLQIDNMDKRIDDIEVVELPAIKKVVGIA